MILGSDLVACKFRNLFTLIQNFIVFKELSHDAAHV